MSRRQDRGNRACLTRRHRFPDTILEISVPLEQVPRARDGHVPRVNQDAARRKFGLADTACGPMIACDSL